MSQLGKNRRFQLERLEDRRMMAGDIHAFVSNGTLFITEQAGHVGGAQSVFVSQLPGGKIRLTGTTSPANPAFPTLIDGQGVAEFSGVSNIQANLGGGKDTIAFHATDPLVRLQNVTVNTTSASTVNDDDVVVVFDKFQVLHKMDVVTGAGRDTVRIDKLTNFGDVWVRTGADDDQVVMKNSSVGVNDNSLLWFDLGAGNDTLDLGSGPNELAFVNGFNVRVDARDGGDRVNMQDVFMKKGVAVQLGAGDDRLEMVNVQSRGSIALRGEIGNDTMKLTQVEAFDDFFAYLGEGSDTLDITFVKARKVELDGGDGDGYDRLFLSQSPNIPTLIRAGFEEINGNKLVKKGILGAATLSTGVATRV